MASKWDSVAIVGVGLIGGSVGLALQARDVANRIVGIGRDPKRLQIAIERGAISEATTDLTAGVEDVDLIVVCAPVDSISNLVQRTAASCPPDALITDAGSTKQQLVQAIESQAVPGQATFVGSHPLAGSEKTGVAHADGDLFENRTVVVTPTPKSAAPAVKSIVDFWSQLGAKVRQMSPTDHDEALAITSHLPHVVASLLAASTPEHQQALVATGWLDTTRVAAGDVDLWLQILMQNRPSVLQRLHEFGIVLNSFEKALQERDTTAIRNHLASGKQRRDALAD